MNQWTNPQSDPQAPLPPWETPKRAPEKGAKRRQKTHGGIIALSLLLVAALILSFAAGFGSIYGLERLADSAGYLYRRPTNPTFSRPQDRSEGSAPSSDTPKNESPSEKQETVPQVPSAETETTEQGKFISSGKTVFPIKDVPRIEQENTAGKKEMSAADIAEARTKSVVSVVAYVSATEIGSFTLGTGMIYSEEGYLLTNHHVVEKADHVKIILYDDTEYEASFICSDEMADIAILKIDAPDLVASPFGYSADLRVGDSVIVIGCPAALELAGTATFGHITGPERYLPMDSAGNVMRLMQTDASINPGNSGGPVINVYGQIVGMVIAKLNARTYEGIGFAISSDRITQVVSDLLDYGYVTGYPMLGFSGSSVDEGMADGKNPKGVLVASVSKNSNAYGVLQSGDVVCSVDGQVVYSIADINVLKGKLNVGDSMHLRVYRDGSTFEADIVLKDKYDVD